MNNPAPATSSFETKTCTRCGGGGRYSFNMMDGDRCYGCYGSGRQYTGRGFAAATHYAESLKVRAADVTVGQLVYEEPSPYNRGRFHVVESVGADALNPGYWRIEAAAFGLATSPDALVRVGWTVDEKREKLAVALAFQATLGRNGKPLAGRTVR